MDIDIKHIAQLARLKIPDEKLESFTEELSSIVKMVENLPALESKDALLDPQDPMLLRADAARPSYNREAILQNAPHAAEGCFMVPKTVD